MNAFLSHTEQKKKALFAALSRKDVFTILSTWHGKYIIFQSLPDVWKYLSLRGYSYPRHAIILVVCPLKCLFWTRLSANCDTVASQQPVWAVETLTTRISCLDVFTIFCYNNVIPLDKLTCLGQQNINLRIRNESFLVGKNHTTLYKYVIIFGAACISLRCPIFIFKDLTNVIFGSGSTKTSEITFRTLKACCAA